MEENNNNNEPEVNKNNFKNETKDAVNKVKDAFKGTDFKSELNNLKNFFVSFAKSPIQTVKSIASGERNGIVISIVLLVLMILLNIIGDAIYYGINEYLEITAKIIVLDIISPIIFVAVFSAMTYFFSGKNKKSIATVIPAIMVAFTLFVIRDIIYVLYTLINEAISIYFIYNMVSLTINFMTMVLLMYTIRELITKTDEEDKDFRRIILIVFVSYAIVCILTKLEIYSSI